MLSWMLLGEGPIRTLSVLWVSPTCLKLCSYSVKASTDNTSTNKHTPCSNKTLQQQY